jgi:hypothetical protein
VNVELSNEVLAKAKSWELPVYQKARGKASEKTHPLLSQAVYGGSASPKTMTRRSPKAQISGGKAAFILPTL